MGLLDPLGNLFSEKLDVLFVRIALKNATERGGGVRMRGRDEHVRRGDAGLLLGHCLGSVVNRARDHAAIDDDEGDLGLAVVEHEAAGVQRIVGGRGLLVGHVAVDGDGELGRRDVLGEGPGTKRGLRMGERIEPKRHRDTEQSRSGFHGVILDVLLMNTD